MMSKKDIVFNYPSKVVFGEGKAKELPHRILELGAKRPALITGPTMPKTQAFSQIKSLLEAAGIEPFLFNGVEPEPPIELLQEVSDLIKKERCDALIGLGGGSTMDFTKVLGVLAELEDVTLDQIVGINKIPRKGLPVILMPTTAGSGSEVSPVAIFTFKDENVKKGIVSPHLVCDVAIVDPVLTWELPRHITASTGMDALVHAIESFISINANPLSKELSLSATKKIYGFLKRAVHDGKDREARYNVALGSLLAGMAFSMAGTAAVHALAYPLGGEFHIPHGVANTVMLRHVLEYNMPGNEKLYREMAEAMTVVGGNGNVSCQSDSVEPFRVIDFVIELAEAIDVPTQLRDLEIPKDAIPRMAEAAFREKRLLGNNPKRLSVDDIRIIYEKAW